MGFLGLDTPMAAHDWAATPLGSIEGWPAALKTTVSLIVNSHFPQCILWGPELVTIPNPQSLAAGGTFRRLGTEAGQ